MHEIAIRLPHLEARNKEPPTEFFFERTILYLPLAHGQALRQAPKPSCSSDCETTSSNILVMT